MTPRQIGTIVVPVTSEGLHLFGAVHPHHGHFAKVISGPKRVTSRSAFVQDIECVPCGTVFPDVNASFLGEVADLKDLMVLLGQIRCVHNVLHRNLKKLEEIIENMRSFESQRICTRR